MKVKSTNKVVALNRLLYLFVVFLFLYVINPVGYYLVAKDQINGRVLLVLKCLFFSSGSILVVFAFFILWALYFPVRTIALLSMQSLLSVGVASWFFSLAYVMWLSVGGVSLEGLCLAVLIGLLFLWFLYVPKKIELIVEANERAFDYPKGLYHYTAVLNPAKNRSVRNEKYKGIMVLWMGLGVMLGSVGFVDYEIKNSLGVVALIYSASFFVYLAMFNLSLSIYSIRKEREYGVKSYVQEFLTHFRTY